jgi:hypothetical protein
MELALEELESSAAEGEVAAERAAAQTTNVVAFTRKRPARQPFPEHLLWIRRAYFAQKKPIKAIRREFRLSRKVVRKMIRSQATEFHYERGRQPFPRIDPWREQLDGMLLANEDKPARFGGHYSRFCLLGLRQPNVLLSPDPRKFWKPMSDRRSQASVRRRQSRCPF